MSEDQHRDRYAEANTDIASHIGDKMIAALRTPENQARIQTVLDPIVSNIISRIFPYILLSAILFLILFLMTIGTFWMVVRNPSASTVPLITAAANVVTQALTPVM